MKCPRNIVGKTGKGRIRNMYINGNLNRKEIYNQIEESELRWFEHIKRMYEHRIS